MELAALEWKVGGQQGEGIDSTGEILARTLFRYGYYVTTYRQFESRIKGGHTDFKVRATPAPTHFHGDKVDILVGFDDETLPVHRPELKPGAVVILEGDGIKVTEEDGYTLAVFPLKAIATELGNPLAKNMIALGITGGLISLPREAFYHFIEEQFKRKGADVIASNKRAVDRGYELAQEHLAHKVKTLPPRDIDPNRLYLSGNEAIAFGAYMAGLTFLSAYPITPASEIMEWLAAKLPKRGGAVMQVEDEIAGITFAIGASFAGARAMTTSSGPGIALKTEAIALAGESETPVVVVDVQRAGPSTGMPTRHEQGDLNHLLHAAHGDFPRIVLYPSSVEDAFYLAAEALNLAEIYQTVVFLVSDLGLGMNKQTTPRFDPRRVEIRRGKIVSEEEARALGEFFFKRYRITEDGISPRPLPGNPYAVALTSSNEHREDGHIDETIEARNAQMEKRMRKLRGLRIRNPFYVDHPDAATLLVAVGSARGPVEEAAAALREEGYDVGTLFLQQLAPLPVEELRTLLVGRHVITVEHNYTGQLLGWLRRHLPIHEHSTTITQYDGRPFFAERIVREAKERIADEHRAERAHA